MMKTDKHTNFSVHNVPTPCRTCSNAINADFRSFVTHEKKRAKCNHRNYYETAQMFWKLFRGVVYATGKPKLIVRFVFNPYSNSLDTI